MRAALLHGPGDLRVGEVPDPVPANGEVLVRVSAATTCGTDVKMWRRGHPALDVYPSPFGHETAGVRADTGQPVLVAPSVACGQCVACRVGRPQICREPGWVLGGFAELIAAPAGSLHAIPDGLRPAAAAMAEPLAAAVHAVARGGDGEDAAVLGGGPMGQMLARLLVLDGRSVTLADRHPERRAQAEAQGARAAETLDRHALVFEAVGSPQAWRTAVQSALPGGTVVLVGGCPAGTDAELPTGPLHYDELDVRGAFHHSRDEVDRALALLAAGDLDWQALAGPRIGLEELPSALSETTGGAARKWVVEPSR
jgi:L-iditol 2-dehydrogenase